MIEDFSMTFDGGEKASSFAESGVRPPADGKDDSETSSMSNKAYKETSKLESEENRQMSKCLDDECLATSSSLSECTTPPYLHWADNLKALLNDREGVKLFFQYLEQEKCTESLNFWLACEGIKNNEQYNDKRKLVKLIQIIYEKYLNSSEVSRAVSTETRQCLADKIYGQNANLCQDVHIFDSAQAEIEKFMSTTLYRNFIQSEMYLLYVQQQQQQQQQNVEDDGSENDSNHSGQHVTRYLATVDENEELREECGDSFVNNLMNLTNQLRHNPRRTRSPPRRDGVTTYAAHFHEVVPSSHRSQRSNPHVFYAPYIPVSVQDSELQSLSSDAHTDDTMSLTDSSVDAFPTTSKKHQRFIRMKASQNRERAGNHEMRPCGMAMPRHPKEAHDTQEFAAELTRRLLLVEQEQLKQEMLKQKLENLRTILNDPERGVRQLDGLKSQQTNDDQENYQNIIDDHVSRLWNESPGAVWSPRAHSPDRRRSSHTAPALSRSCNNHHHNHHRVRRRERDLTPNSITDVRNERDYSRMTAHDVRDKSQSKTTSSRRDDYLDSAFQPSDASGDHWIPRDGGGRRGKNELDEVEVDSGVYGSTTISSNERVVHWVLNNDKYSNFHSDFDKDSSSRHRKSTSSSYSALSNSSPAPSGKTKKAVAYNVSRPGCLEHGGAPWQQLSQNTSTQDPSKLKPKVPDTTVQLEEARRRLELDAKMRLNRNKHGSSSKEKSYVDLPVKSRTLPKSSSSPPLDLLASTSATTTTKKAPRKSMPLSASNSPTSTWTVGADTWIKYQFKGEPNQYSINVKGQAITLAQFKRILARKGKFRYFFKKASNESSSGAVNEEIIEDNEILPLWEGEVCAKVESID